MRINIIFFFFLLFQTLFGANLQAASTNPFVGTNVEQIEAEWGQTKPRKAAKKSKELKNKHIKHKNNRTEDEKPFPLFAMLGTIAGVLGLFFCLGLGIYLSFPAFIGIIGLVFAIGALVLGIMGLKKGENKNFSYVAIMLGVVGILGAIFYMISVL